MYTYALDIDEANSTGSPKWKYLHDYKTEYGLDDLSPQSMLSLAKAFQTDTDLANTFTWNTHARRSAKPTAVDQLGLSCQTASSEMHEEHDCLTNAGFNQGKYGLGYDLWTAQGFADWLINDWIEVSVKP